MIQIEIVIPVREGETAKPLAYPLRAKKIKLQKKALIFEKMPKY